MDFVRVKKSENFIVRALFLRFAGNLAGLHEPAVNPVFQEEAGGERKIRGERTKRPVPSPRLNTKHLPRPWLFEDGKIPSGHLPGNLNLKYYNTGRRKNIFHRVDGGNLAAKLEKGS